MKFKIFDENFKHFRGQDAVLTEIYYIYNATADPKLFQSDKSKPRHDLILQ